MKAPCLNCTERHFRCHGECEKYAAFDRQNKMKNAARRAAVEVRSFDYEILRPVRRLAQ